MLNSIFLNDLLFLIPEIALTSQLIERFNKQFNSTIAIWHSDISNSKKRDNYECFAACT